MGPPILSDLHHADKAPRHRPRVIEILEAREEWHPTHREPHPKRHPQNLEAVRAQPHDGHGLCRRVNQGLRVAAARWAICVALALAANAEVQASAAPHLQPRKLKRLPARLRRAHEVDIVRKGHHVDAPPTKSLHGVHEDRVETQREQERAEDIALRDARLAPDGHHRPRRVTDVQGIVPNIESAHPRQQLRKVHPKLLQELPAGQAVEGVLGVDLHDHHLLALCDGLLCDRTQRHEDLLRPTLGHHAVLQRLEVRADPIGKLAHHATRREATNALAHTNRTQVLGARLGDAQQHAGPERVSHTLRQSPPGHRLQKPRHHIQPSLAATHDHSPKDIRHHP